MTALLVAVLLVALLALVVGGWRWLLAAHQRGVPLYQLVLVAVVHGTASGLLAVALVACILAL